MCVPKSKWAFEPMSSLKKSVIFFSIPNYALKLKLAKKRIFKNPVFFSRRGIRDDHDIMERKGDTKYCLEPPLIN